MNILSAKLIVPTVIAFVMIYQLFRGKAYIKMGAMKSVDRGQQPKLYWFLILLQALIYSFIIYEVVLNI
jgi:hypothetical protein